MGPGQRGPGQMGPEQIGAGQKDSRKLVFQQYYSNLNMFLRGLKVNRQQYSYAVV